MLNSIKEMIEEPVEPFCEFYQDYVWSIQQAIVRHDINLAHSSFKSIDDVNVIIKGLNSITEELKKW